MSKMGLGEPKTQKHETKHKRSLVLALVAVISIFLVESCHIDQMTEYMVVVDGGEGWGR